MCIHPGRFSTCRRLTPDVPSNRAIGPHDKQRRSSNHNILFPNAFGLVIKWHQSLKTKRDEAHRLRNRNRICCPCTCLLVAASPGTLGSRANRRITRRPCPIHVGNSVLCLFAHSFSFIQIPPTLFELSSRCCNYSNFQPFSTLLLPCHLSILPDPHQCHHYPHATSFKLHTTVLPMRPSSVPTVHEFDFH